jgi:putative transcriptional regulator
MARSKTDLARARESAGLSQKELAERLDIAQSTLSRIEHGKLVPDAAVAADLIQILGITLDDVLRPSQNDAAGRADKAA